MSEQTGVALAARVAVEARGWHKAEAYFDPEMPKSLWWFNANDERQHRVSLYRPDLNIAQAMEVVPVVLERVKKLGRGSHFSLNIDDKGVRTAQFLMPFEARSCEGLSVWTGNGSTEARSIVLAALKAAEATK